MEDDDYDPKRVTDEEARVAVQDWLAHRKRLRRRYLVLLISSVAVAILFEVIALLTHIWGWRIPAFACYAAFFFFLYSYRDNRTL